MVPRYLLFRPRAGVYSLNACLVDNFYMGIGIEAYLTRQTRVRAKVALGREYGFFRLAHRAELA